MTDQLFDPAAVLELLKARYPVFQDCRPLAIGTGPTLVAAAADLGLSKKTIRRFLQQRTHSAVYLRKLAAVGAMRYALDGTVVEPVSAADQATALAKLEERALAKREAARPPRKPAPAPEPRKAAAPLPAPAPVPTAARVLPVLKLKPKAKAKP